MYCSKCGVQNSDGSTYCANCGSTLVELFQQPGIQAGPAAAGEPKTCGFAIASLVMGLLCLTCVLWPILVFPAIICGIIALFKIIKNKPRLKGFWLAIAGMAIPAFMTVLLPIMAIVLGITLPAVSKAKMTAQRAVCRTNLKQLIIGMEIYMTDYDAYPTPQQWCDLLMQEAGEPAISFQCRLDPEGTFSYAVNENLYTIEPGKVSEQWPIVAIFESNLGRNGVGGPDDLVLRHNQHGQSGCNIVYSDGHVEFVTEDRVADLKWTVE